MREIEMLASFCGETPIFKQQNPDLQRKFKHLAGPWFGCDGM
jgi:hypothetical protein